MFNRHHICAIVSFLLIPALAVLGAMLSNFIDPENAAGYPDYERNYRLMELAKNLSLLATLLAMAGSWFLTCYLLLKSKARSCGWLLLGVLGPFGLIVLTLLGDKAPAPGDSYRQFVGRLRIPLRAALELGLFAAAWVVAYQVMLLKRGLMILYEAARTGASTAQIIDQHNASSGMWAFSEGLEVCYLVVLFYLLWPIVFNAVARLPRLRASSKKL